MAIMQNELESLNAEALRNAQQVDTQLRDKAAPQQQAPQVDVSPNAVTKQLNSLAQKAQANPQDVPGGFSGPSPDMIKMLQLSHNYHQVKQATAQQKLVEMGNQVRMGFAPDVKQMMKYMKQSGLKVDTTPEGIALATNYYKNYYGEQDPVTGQSRGEMPKEIQMMQEKAQAGQLSRKDLTQFVMGGMIRNDMRSQRFAAYNDTQKAAIERTGNELLEKFVDDKIPPDQRSETMGKLGLLFPNIGQMADHWLKYEAATPEQRANQVAIASGAMTPKELAARSDNLFQTYMEAGLGPDLARQAADAAANNKPMPASVMAAMPKITPTNVAMTTQAMKALSDIGIPGNMLEGALTAYLAKGSEGLKGFLPPKTPVQIQQDFQQKMLGLEERRTAATEMEARASAQRAQTAENMSESEIQLRQAEADRANRMAAKLGIDPDSKEATMLIDGIKFFAGIKNPTPGMKLLQQQMEDSLAQALGGSIKRDKGWFGRSVTEWQAGTQDTKDSGLADVIGSAQKGTPQAANPAQSSNPPADKDLHDRLHDLLSLPKSKAQQQGAK